MTTKDFRLIAATLLEAKPTPAQPRGIEFRAAIFQWQITVDIFANQLQALNPKFKRDLFLTACGR